MAQIIESIISSKGFQADRWWFQQDCSIHGLCAKRLSLIGGEMGVQTFHHRSVESSNHWDIIYNISIQEIWYPRLSDGTLDRSRNRLTLVVQLIWCLSADLIIIWYHQYCDVRSVRSAVTRLNKSVPSALPPAWCVQADHIIISGL